MKKLFEIYEFQNKGFKFEFASLFLQLSLSDVYVTLVIVIGDREKVYGGGYFSNRFLQ